MTVCVERYCSTCHNPALVWSACAPHVDSRRVFAACVERYCSTLAPVVPYASCVERLLSALSFLRACCVLCGAVLLHTTFSKCPVGLVWCIPAPHVIIRHLCGAPVLHMLGSGGCLRPVWSDSTERKRVRRIPFPALGDWFQVAGLGSRLPQLRGTGVIGLGAGKCPPSTAQGAVEGLREERGPPSTPKPAGSWLRAESPPSMGNV